MAKQGIFSREQGARLSQRGNLSLLLRGSRSHRHPLLAKVHPLDSRGVTSSTAGRENYAHEPFRREENVPLLGTQAPQLRHVPTMIAVSAGAYYYSIHVRTAALEASAAAVLRSQNEV
jgi:hypothetical protein